MGGWARKQWEDPPLWFPGRGRAPRVKFFRKLPFLTVLTLTTSEAGTKPSNPLTAEQYEQLRLVVTDACVDMFTSSGFAVRVLSLNAPPPKHANDIAGVIGFAGAVRGTLMISARSQLFRSTNPAMDNATSPSDVDSSDWTGEMANQILGRVKRRFCERGRDFQADPPCAIEGREISRRFPDRAGVVDLALAVGGDLLLICFEVTPPIDGQLFPEAAQPIAVSSEGEMFLF